MTSSFLNIQHDLDLNKQRLADLGEDIVTMSIHTYDVYANPLKQSFEVHQIEDAADLGELYAPEEMALHQLTLTENAIAKLQTTLFIIDAQNELAKRIPAAQVTAKALVEETAADDMSAFPVLLKELFALKMKTSALSLPIVADEQSLMLETTQLVDAFAATAQGAVNQELAALGDQALLEKVFEYRMHFLDLSNDRLGYDIDTLEVKSQEAFF